MNAGGNLIKQTDTIGREAFFEYDELSRLLPQTTPEGAKTEYRYDAMGNLTVANGGRISQVSRHRIHLRQVSRGVLAEASTRYHGVGKRGQDILHSRYGKNNPNPRYPINRKQFGYDTKGYWKWREQQ